MAAVFKARHEAGIALAFFAAFAVSSDGVLVKLASRDGASVPAIMILKSTTAAVTTVVLQLTIEPLIAAYRRERFACPALSRMGVLHILIGGVFSGVVFAGFTLAFYLTTSANVLAFTALAPIWTSLLTKPVLGEVVRWRTVWANVGALLGSAVVVTGVALSSQAEGDERSVEDGVAGIVCAIVTGISSAFFFTTIRSASVRAPGTPMLYASTFGMVLATAFGFALVPAFHPQGEPLFVEASVKWLVLNGCACVALALTSITYAVRLTPPVEVSLIMQLEGLLGPISTFLVLREVPSVFTLAGGGFVLACVIAHEALSIREQYARRMSEKGRAPEEGAEDEVESSSMGDKDVSVSA
jgi:drug/metabolite transporter (DMT)-like permease